ncbi:MAG: DUF4159 domain-containing protein [Planktomarina sp.]
MAVSNAARGAVMITFALPLVLLGLLAIPLLWILLRAIPPAPVLRRFPAVTLLLGLKEEQVEADQTPWWLLILRALAIAALIVGFAGPVWQNTPQTASDRPLLVMMDAGWASAPDWAVRQDQAASVIDAADRAGRSVSFVTLTGGEGVPFGPAGLAARTAAGVSPQAWLPDGKLVLDFVSDLEGPFDTYWIVGSAQFEEHQEIARVLASQGDVTVFETGRDALALRPAILTPEGVEVTVDRAGLGTQNTVTLQAIGTDPSGQMRVLTTAVLAFEEGALTATQSIDLPVELRDRVTRFQIANLRSAAGITLSDDRLKRREIALVSATAEGQEGLALLSQLHFLRQALVPSSDLLDGAIADIIQANPDTLILSDVPSVPNPDRVLDWVADGGLLIRFAGPRMAAESFDIAVDPLLPVRLRAGGRTVGGAMSWGAPKTLRAFAADSPFFGLKTPEDVTINAQVLAEPGPDLAHAVIARLEDGTPLVTRKEHGQGQIILFHVTANASWSSLPLSGLFMQMLERLSVSTGQIPTDPADLDRTIWAQVAEVDGFGNTFATTARAGIKGADMLTPLSIDLPPGQYTGDDRILARNVVGTDDVIARPNWPDGVTVVGLEGPTAADLKPWLLLAGMALILLDVLVALAISGKLRGPVVAALLAFSLVPQDASAQDDDKILQAASEVVLAYVRTGDVRQDEISEAGLQGLSDTLFLRTAIEPATPAGLDLAVDELSLYPFIYWPVTLDQSAPTDDTMAKLNRYLRTGGMIMFDTRDGHVASFGANTAEGRKLRELAAGLQLPPLAPVPEGHVLTRSFYLLQDFPGRHMGAPVWVEATAPTATEGPTAFANLNDGVTPVIIGGNDWAAAWATDAEGRPLLPVGRGYAGERQREIARRFGVNILMHVLTGNYKADQVHVPALLDRLGQ